MSLVETMCQHRKRELLIFFPSSALGLASHRAAVMWSGVIAEGVYAGPWVPGTDSSHCSFCWSMGFCEAKSLSSLGHLHVSWDLALQLQDLLVSVSHRGQSRSLLFGKVCTTWEPLLKILLHGKIVYNSIFLLSGNSKEFGRRGSQEKAVRVGECV